MKNGQWWDKSWNTISGCDPCSAGCLHCWAKGMADRFNGGDFSLKLHPDKLDKPLHWRKPRRIFVCSMSDLFHPKVPFEFIDKIFNTICDAPQHLYQILTKRPKRMADYIYQAYGKRVAYKNVWLGVTVCTQKEKPKIDILRQIPAAVRFISFEPLLADMRELNLDGIHQVIVGGESGPKARPMHPDWARGIRDQCIAAGVPFFFKQWGEYTNDGPGLVIENDVVFLKDGTLMDVKDVMKDWRKYYDSPTDCVWMKRIGKKKAGSLLDGKEWKQYPKDTK